MSELANFLLLAMQSLLVSLDSLVEDNFDVSYHLTFETVCHSLHNHLCTDLYQCQLAIRTRHYQVQPSNAFHVRVQSEEKFDCPHPLEDPFGAGLIEIVCNLVKLFEMEEHFVESATQ